MLSNSITEPITQLNNQSNQYKSINNKFIT